MAWVYLIVAGLLEMMSVGFMNRFNEKRDWLSVGLLVTGFGGSFFFLSLAMKVLPMGLSYAIWTGIGAAGGALIGIVLYKEPKNALRIACICVIVGSVAALKFMT